MKKEYNINKNRNTKNFNQEGFSLLEVLLSVGILAFVMIGFIQIIQSYVEERRALLAAEHMKTVHEAAYAYIMDNFSEIYNNLGGDGGTGNRIEITIDDIKTNPTLLPASFSTENPYGQPLIVIVRNAGNRNVEAVVMSTGRLVSERQLQAAAGFIGGYGGFWSAVNRSVEVGETTINNVVGAFGMWSVPVASLSTPTWPAGDSPTLASGGYLATYQWINFVGDLGDYLYRFAIAGVPEINTMMTNINMNNYIVDGADDINIQGDLGISENAFFDGTVRVEGRTEVQQSLASQGNVSVGELGTFESDVDIGGDPGDGTITTNDFRRDAANVDGVDILVGGTLGVANNVAGIGTLNVENATVPGVVTSDASLLAVSIDVGEILVSTGGTIEANTITGGTVTTPAAVTTETMSGNEANIIGNVEVSTEAVIFGGSLEFEEGAEFTCGIGC